jgi:hypothetical protein
MSPLVKTLLFPFVILACLGGAFIAWVALVVVTGLAIPWAAWKVLGELYEEGK